MKARLIAREAPILHLELTDCDSLAFSQAKNIFGSKGKIISALLDLCNLKLLLMSLRLEVFELLNIAIARLGNGAYDP